MGRQSVRRSRQLPIGSRVPAGIPSSLANVDLRETSVPGLERLSTREKVAHSQEARVRSKTRVKAKKPVADGVPIEIFSELNDFSSQLSSLANALNTLLDGMRPEASGYVTAPAVAKRAEPTTTAPAAMRGRAANRINRALSADLAISQAANTTEWPRSSETSRSLKHTKSGSVDTSNVFEKLEKRASSSYGVDVKVLRVSFDENQRLPQPPTSLPGPSPPHQSGRTWTEGQAPHAAHAVWNETPVQQQHAYNRTFDPLVDTLGLNLVGQDEPAVLPLDYPLVCSQANDEDTGDFCIAKSCESLGSVVSEVPCPSGQSSKHVAGHFIKQQTRNMELDMAETSDVMVRKATTIENRSNMPHVLLPDSPNRNAWDLFSFIVLLYDSVMIPYNFAFRPDETAWVVGGMWFTMIFWTCDMLLSFNTGFYVRGELELHRFAIARHYLRTTFVFDAIASGSDWATALLRFGGDNGRMVLVFRVLKTQRIVRIVRFLRFSSLWNRLEGVHAVFLSDGWQICIQIFTMLYAIILVNHFICCTWYYIGSLNHNDTGARWLDIETDVGGRLVPMSDFDTLYQYVTAFHWSVVQLWVGSISVEAKNSVERVFSCICNLFGTFFTAVITSWFSALLVQYQQQEHDFKKCMKDVRRYLRENNIRPELASRIQQQLSTRLATRRRDSEEDIEAFGLLSKNLKSGMRSEVMCPSLFVSPFLFLVDNVDHNLLLAFVLTLEYQCMAIGEELFVPGVKVEHASVILRGALYYFREMDITRVESFHSGDFHRPVPSSPGRRSTGLGNSTDTMYGESQWMAEAALWMDDWYAVGLAECCQDAELINVDSAKLEDVCERTMRAKDLLHAYRNTYNDLANMQPPEALNDISPPVDHGLVVMTMRSSARVFAAQPVLELLRNRENQVLSFINRSPKGADDLEKEVESGECGLIFTAERTPIRVAFVVLIRAEKSDGTILIQVAKANNGVMVPKLQMPGTKMKEGEVPLDAAKRILSKSLGEFGGNLGLGNGKCTQDEEIRDTANYGIQTRFLRTVYHVQFENSSRAPPEIELSGGDREPAQCESLRHASKERGSKHGGRTSFNADMKSSMQQKKLTKKGSFDRFMKPKDAPVFDALSALLPQRLYFVGSGPGHGTIYTWMTHSVYEMLNCREHASVLQDWVSTFYIPAASDDDDVGYAVHSFDNN